MIALSPLASWAVFLGAGVLAVVVARALTRRPTPDTLDRVHVETTRQYIVAMRMLSKEHAAAAGHRAGDRGLTAPRCDVCRFLREPEDYRGSGIG